ncbi:MAG: 30S ribosomal protein S8 [Myxococcota bacterium]|jgi:small subunit ribosomal protein S8|nr:30S ribosomal protein S8 [Myxococcales bacterium]MBF94472.1 30S ribosomal protein S8 [Myxococcales bacterium]MEC7751329.1 30S ribosomal protein S8 [Myxococcota bacterium]HBU47387.1 30S ribosomal protein S8 [Myxococcales bacterium]|tara:strand:+ start:289 stop:693 length:405 start_codon:yes stop_codon:yes gene_type:complete
MVISDPIADMLTRIRNAIMARHESLTIPGSTIKKSIAEILQQEGYISRTDWTAPSAGNPQGSIDIRLKWDGKDSVIDGLKRISKPGRRIYVGHGDLPKVRNGLGIAILSTSSGVMTEKSARNAGIGGEVLCEIW